MHGRQNSVVLSAQVRIRERLDLRQEINRLREKLPNPRACHFNSLESHCQTGLVLIAGSAYSESCVNSDTEFERWRVSGWAPKRRSFRTARRFAQRRE